MASDKAPVVFLFFNRHTTALKVFERIRLARPKRLVLVSDGPRETVVGEDVRVHDLRRKIENMIDWDVQVEKDYAPVNLGCSRRLASGIEAALSKYGKAIFVEDDCLPTVSFFDYAQYMLEKYENEPRVTSISGTYFLKKKKTSFDYGFTHFPQIWGWACWARSWEGYDRQLTNWDNAFLDDIARSGDIPCFDLKSWQDTFDGIQRNPDGTWDIQFWLLCLKKRGLTIFPYRNQITNIGANSDATHTLRWWFSDKPIYEYGISVRPRQETEIDYEYERYLQNEFYSYRITRNNFYHLPRLYARIAVRKILKSLGN